MITGKELKAARKLQGLSLRQLAEKIGIHHTAIHRAENDGAEKMSYSYIMLIAHGLGMDIPPIEAKNRAEADLIGAMRNKDYALALRIIAAHVEEKESES